MTKVVRGPGPVGINNKGQLSRFGVVDAHGRQRDGGLLVQPDLTGTAGVDKAMTCFFLNDCKMIHVYIYIFIYYYYYMYI